MISLWNYQLDFLSWTKREKENGERWCVEMQSEGGIRKRKAREWGNNWGCCFHLTAGETQVHALSFTFSPRPLPQSFSLSLPPHSLCRSTGRNRVTFARFFQLSSSNDGQISFRDTQRKDLQRNGAISNDSRYSKNRYERTCNIGKKCSYIIILWHIVRRISLNIDCFLGCEKCMRSNCVALIFSAINQRYVVRIRYGTRHRSLARLNAHRIFPTYISTVSPFVHSADVQNAKVGKRKLLVIDGLH